MAKVNVRIKAKIGGKIEFRMIGQGDKIFKGKLIKQLDNSVIIEIPAKLQKS